MAKMAEVQIIMGSDSDLPVMKKAAAVLKKFKLKYDIRILSAHRSPEDVKKFSIAAKKSGAKIIIAGAGGAAHLAGVVASLTTLPVIGVPMESKALKGIDSLLSTVQMPSGVPVATVSIGAVGAKNAAILAAHILGLNNKKLSAALVRFKKDLAAGVRSKNRKLKI